MKMNQAQAQQINNCDVTNRFIFVEQFFQGIYITPSFTTTPSRVYIYRFIKNQRAHRL